MSRREFSVAVKKAAWARCAGRCEGCGIEFSAANRAEYDHRVEDAIGGDPTLDNCVVLGKKCCHDPKGVARAPVLAKVARLEKKAANIRPRKAIISGSRGTPWKKKINGQAVRRDE